MVGLDLGEAAAINALVESYRSALQDPGRTDVKRVARTLDEKIMQLFTVAADARASMLWKGEDYFSDPTGGEIGHSPRTS